MEGDLQLDPERLHIILKPGLGHDICRFRKLALGVDLSSISRAYSKREVGRSCSFRQFSALCSIDPGRAEDGKKSCTRRARVFSVLRGEPFRRTLNSARGSGTAPACSSTYRHDQRGTETETTFSRNRRISRFHRRALQCVAERQRLGTRRPQEQWRNERCGHKALLFGRPNHSGLPPSTFTTF
jgi:hypothetical protein